MLYCSRKSLSTSLTCILPAVKFWFQSYCDTSYLRGGVIQVWIMAICHLWLKFQRNRKQISSGYMYQQNYQYLIPLSSSLCNVISHKNVRGIACLDNNILVMEVKQVFISIILAWLGLWGLTSIMRNSKHLFDHIQYDVRLM
jgi:hypothetical protein